MSEIEPPPPWAVTPDAQFEGCCIECKDIDLYSLYLEWRRFWTSLSEEERAAYLLRFPPGSRWEDYLANLAFDNEIARIDAEDIAAGVLQPNGSPWPEPEVVRPALWRRLLRWR